VSALFGRFTLLALAVEPEQVEPLHSVVINDGAALPVLLRHIGRNRAHPRRTGGPGNAFTVSAESHDGGVNEPVVLVLGDRGGKRLGGGLRCGSGAADDELALAL
jgi:hypothetical protein